MPIDPYSPCPGGTGKKVKFCCPDLLGELEKVYRMLEGEQRVACLEHIEKLEAKYPDRACLLSLKSTLQMHLGQKEQAEATLASYTQKYPDNPVALSESAITKVDQGDVQAAVGLLQQALAACEHEMPHQVYSTIGLVAQLCIASGHIMAARHHLMLQMSIRLETEDKRPLAMLMRLNGSPEVPLLLKEDTPLRPAPDDALWKSGFNATLELAHRGMWQKAATQLRELAAKVGDWPHIWRTIAALSGRIADEAGTVEALRKFAAQEVPLDDAVEAEALAQLLDPETDADKIDVINVSFTVGNADELLARLAAHRQSDRMPDELLRMGAGDEPPPKAGYWVLDRDLPSSGAGIAQDAVPRIVGRVSVFGKQTDREARAELNTYRNEQEAIARRVLAEIAGDTLGAAGEEKVLGQIAVANLALNVNVRLPDDTPPRERRNLVSAEHARRVMSVWPELPRTLFGGKSARAAAGDGAYRIKLLAAILSLELADVNAQSGFDYNQLRRELGLPTADAIDPAQAAVRDLPLMRLARLDVSKLADDDLIDAFQRAEHFRCDIALRKLALEIVSRESLNEKVHKAEVYGVLAQIESDGEQALKYIDEGRKLTEAAGGSSAQWDIDELGLRIALGQGTEAEQLLNHIRSQHMREPGVAQALMQVLVDAGVLHPDGTPVAAPQSAPGIVVPGAAAAEPGKIWTPDSQSAAGGKKSAIWTPSD